MRRRVKWLSFVFVVLLTVCAAAAADEDCPSAAIAHDSTVVETPYGRFEVKVCVSTDANQMMYTFSLTNLDSCPLERFSLRPFVGGAAAQLEESYQWQTDQQDPHWWAWEGPFWAPVRTGETREFIVRVSGSTMARAISGAARFSEHLDCGITDHVFELFRGEKTGEIEPDTGPNLPIAGAYLLVFNDHDCTLPGTLPDMPCHDPKYQRIQVVQSDDGISWERIPGLVPFPGGVPGVVRRGDTLYVYYGRKFQGRPLHELQVRRYHFDTGVWEEPVSVSLSGARAPYYPLSPGYESSMEHCAILDSEGRIVLFYRLEYAPEQHAGKEGNTEYIRSATEKSGSDGSAFHVDAGERLVIAPPSEGVEVAANPVLFRGPEGYIIYFHTNGGCFAVESPELRGTYAPVAGLPGGILFKSPFEHPAGYYDAATDLYWTYALAERSDGQDVLYRAVHSSIRRPLQESNFRPVFELEDIPGADAKYLSSEGAGIAHARVIAIIPWPQTPSGDNTNDRDGDGVPDENDFCPDYPGKPGTNGC